MPSDDYINKRLKELDKLKRMAQKENPRTRIEQVHRPDHYNKTGTETINIIKNSMAPEDFKGYLKGNILKYVCRYEHKGMPIKDLMKARWYLNRLIKELENPENNDDEIK
jgi:hypothetical protein|tara:strand:- start:427 stop:756 length:330 start_codon:yes stop_codon:yes gene_type:complete